MMNAQIHLSKISDRCGWLCRVFTLGEDSLSTSLTSELVDFRVANADQRAVGAWAKLELLLPIKQATAVGGLFYCDVTPI